MRAHLSDVSVRALKPADKQYRVWDTKTPGFGVSVSDRSKSWIVMYGVKRTLKVLGRYPDVTLAEARKKALVLLGTQPERSEAPKFSDALDQFLDIHGRKLKASSKAETERSLRRHFLPTLASRTVDKLTFGQIANIVERIEKPSEALHAYRNIRTFMSWCVPRFIAHSPCEGMKPPHKYVPRTRVLTENELRLVWLDAEEQGYPFGTLIQLCILTGQRWGELVSLTWPQIGERLTFPETKNGREHVIPIGDLTRRVLASVQRREDVLFPGRKGEPWNGAGKSQWEMRKRLGIPHFTIHDLRRTWASMCAAWTAPHVLERALNHVSGQISGVAAIYNRFSYEAELKACYAQWEVKLASLMQHKVAA